jgi:hypothetical protein
VIDRTVGVLPICEDRFVLHPGYDHLIEKTMENHRIFFGVMVASRCLRRYVIASGEGLSEERCIASRSKRVSFASVPHSFYGLGESSLTIKVYPTVFQPKVARRRSDSFLVMRYLCTSFHNSPRPRKCLMIRMKPGERNFDSRMNAHNVPIRVPYLLRHITVHTQPG